MQHSMLRSNRTMSFAKWYRTEWYPRRRNNCPGQCSATDPSEFAAATVPANRAAQRRWSRRTVCTALFRRRSFCTNSFRCGRIWCTHCHRFWLTMHCWWPRIVNFPVASLLMVECVKSAYEYWRNRKGVASNFKTQKMRVVLIISFLILYLFLSGWFWLPLLLFRATLFVIMCILNERTISYLSTMQNVWVLSS